MNDVEVNFIEVSAEFCVRFSRRILGHGGNIAKGGRTFSPLEERGVVVGGDDVGGIPEFSAPEEAVEF